MGGRRLVLVRYPYPLTPLEAQLLRLLQVPLERDRRINRAGKIAAVGAAGTNGMNGTVSKARPRISADKIEKRGTIERIASD